VHQLDRSPLQGAARPTSRFEHWFARFARHDHPRRRAPAEPQQVVAQRLRQEALLRNSSAPTAPCRLDSLAPSAPWISGSARSGRASPSRRRRCTAGRCWSGGRRRG
jgi:hypothetical protein